MKLSPCPTLDAPKLIGSHKSNLASGIGFENGQPVPICNPECADDSITFKAAVEQRARELTQAAIARLGAWLEGSPSPANSVNSRGVRVRAIFGPRDGTDAQLARDNGLVKAVFTFARSQFVQEFGYLPTINSRSPQGRQKMSTAGKEAWKRPRKKKPDLATGPLEMKIDDESTDALKAGVNCEKGQP